MPDYLTKEEIRQWRSSLERITLEEYAKRLGKVINNEKETNDMVDVVYKHHSSEVRYVSNETTTNSNNNFKAEKISALAQQSFEREKEISLEKVKRELKKAQQAQKQDAKKSEVKAEIKQTHKAKTTARVKEVKPVLPKASIVKEEVQVTFKKNLTPREQAVFEHFMNHKNSIVYAKELAQVLDLPRDYVYKYIKNLRAKMNENAIQNADNGGFILEIK